MWIIAQRDEQPPPDADTIDGQLRTYMKVVAVNKGLDDAQEFTLLTVRAIMNGVMLTGRTPHWD